MEDATDTVFREVVAGIADPEFLQVLYTEFASIEGLNHPVGKINVGHRLLVTESGSAETEEHTFGCTDLGKKAFTSSRGWYS